MSAAVALGDVVVVAVGQHVPHGHEQEGMRPGIAVGIPERAGIPRFPVLIVAPLTTQTGDWALLSPLLYPRLTAGVAGLPPDSAVLLDNLRAVDARRVLRRLGALSEQDLSDVQTALRARLGLADQTPSAA